MVIFEKKKYKIVSKYTLKRTKLHRFKKFSRGSMPPNPPSNAHSFAMHSMSLRDMQILKFEKKNSWPPPLPNPGDAPVYYSIYKHELIYIHNERIFHGILG